MWTFLLQDFKIKLVILISTVFNFGNALWRKLNVNFLLPSMKTYVILKPTQSILVPAFRLGDKGLRSHKLVIASAISIIIIIIIAPFHKHTIHLPYWSVRGIIGLSKNLITSFHFTVYIHWCRRDPMLVHEAGAKYNCCSIDKHSRNIYWK